MTCLPINAKYFLQDGMIRIGRFFMCVLAGINCLTNAHCISSSFIDKVQCISAPLFTATPTVECSIGVICYAVDLCIIVTLITCNSPNIQAYYYLQICNGALPVSLSYIVP